MSVLSISDLTHLKQSSWFHLWPCLIPQAFPFLWMTTVSETSWSLLYLQHILLVPPSKCTQYTNTLPLLGCWLLGLCSPHISGKLYLRLSSICFHAEPSKLTQGTLASAEILHLTYRTVKSLPLSHRSRWSSCLAHCRTSLPSSSTALPRGHQLHPHGLPAVPEMCQVLSLHWHFALPEVLFSRFLLVHSVHSDHCIRNCHYLPTSLINFSA